MKVENGIIKHQYLLCPRNDVQMLKPRQKSLHFCIQNTKLLTGFFIDIIKTDTDRCFS